MITINITVMDADHVPGTGAITFLQIISFIFYKNLMKEILVSFALINETRLRDVTELESSTARL